MKIETIILGCLKKHISGLQEDKECFLNGISEYAKDNKMDGLLKDERSVETAEFLKKAVHSFSSSGNFYNNLEENPIFFRENEL